MKKREQKPEKAKWKEKYQKWIHIDLPFDEAVKKIIQAPPPKKK